MKKILVSACLLGEKVRYDGGGFDLEHPVIEEWRKHGLIVRACPEVDAGLPTPRSPAEIQNGTGSDVWNKTACIINRDGQDVTTAFKEGAQKALDLAIKEKIKVAVLKQNSPSCGSSMIYDGTFSGNKIKGRGTTGELLVQHGITVFSEDEIDKAYEYWRYLQNQFQ